MADDASKLDVTSPFTAAVGQARNAAEEFTRLFAQMKLPAVPNVEAVLAAHKRNLESLSEANKIALEGAQAVAKRHLEIMQQTATEMTETLRSISSTDGSQAKAAKQADLLKSAYEHAVSNAKELADLIQKSNSDAIGVLNRRFSEALDEVKVLMQNTTKS